MSTAIQLEPATDRAGGDAPVGVFYPAHFGGLLSNRSRWQYENENENENENEIGSGRGDGDGEAFSKPGEGESAAEGARTFPRL